MARDFANSTTDFLTAGSSFIDATTPRPVTVSLWFNADVANISHWFLNNNYNSAAPRFGVQLFRYSGATYRMQLYSNGGYAGAGESAFTLTAAELHHYAWTWAADDTVEFYRDGSKLGENTRTLGGTATDGAALNSLNGSLAGFACDGKLAEFAVYDEVLGTDDLAQLGDRICPLMVRPDALTNYLPLGGVYDADDGDHDIVGGNHMSVSGSVGTADHPGGLIYPSQALLVPSGGGAPPTFAGRNKILGSGILAG